jgi:hypothetical protein
MNESLPPEESDPRPTDGDKVDGFDDPIAAFLSDIWEESKEGSAGVTGGQGVGRGDATGPVGRGEVPADEQGGASTSPDSESASSETDASTSGDPAPLDPANADLAASAPAPNQFGVPPFGARPRFEDSFRPYEDSANSSRRRTILAAAGAVLAIAAVALVWVGVSVLFDSNDGKLVTRIDDRAAPGFEAVVEKTPTGLVLMVGDDGELASATVVALGSSTAGGVLSIPVETDVYVSVGEGFVAPVALQELVRSSGAEIAGTVLGELLNLSFSDVVVLRPSDLTDRVPSSLTVNNPSPVTAPNGEILFAKGSVTLSSGELWDFISASSDSEEPVARAARQEAFWKGWLASATPVSTGPAAIDRYLSALSGDQVTYQTIPVSEVAGGDGQQSRLRLSPGVSGAEAVSSIVPLPEGSPGRRPKLRVVDGTGQLDAAQGAAVVLAAGGGQVDIIGNSRLFGFKKTQIVYYEDSQKASAEEMREVLGVGEIVQSTQTNSALDLNITLGEDYLGRFGTAPDGGSGD